MKKSVLIGVIVGVVVLVGLVLGVVFGLLSNNSNDTTPPSTENLPETNLVFLVGFEKYGYTANQISEMSEILTNVGITSVKDLEVEEISKDMRIVRGVCSRDEAVEVFSAHISVDEIYVEFVIYKGEIARISVSAGENASLDGVNERGVSLYDKDEGGYLNKVDWEQGAIIKHPENNNDNPSNPPAGEHTHKYTSAITEPTCIKKGFTTHTCSCGDSFVDNYVDETEHVFGDWKETKAPTCTAKGEETRSCDCGYEETRETAIKEHSYTSVITAPTCTERGYTAYTCNCGDSYLDNYVKALGHDKIPHSEKTPTCTEIGWDAYDTCSKCNYSTYNELGIIAHTPSDWIIDKDATYTSSGTKHKECTECGTLVETSIIPMKSHSYTSVVTAPTCTEQGYTTHTCSECGDVYIDDYTSALNHDLDMWNQIIFPTCTQEGKERRDCLRCNYYEIRAIGVVAHEYTIDVITPPTCTEQGYTTHICTCGDSYIDSYERIIDHTYDEWYVSIEPTCTENGEERAYCHYCGYYLLNIIYATGCHDYERFVVSDSTCTQRGEYKYVCQTCSDSYSIFYDAYGHNYWSWETIKQPTLTEEGVEQRGCYTCGELETRPIPVRTPSEGLEMTLNADGKSYSVTGMGICTDQHIYIPSKYNGLPVTAIGDSAFTGCSFESITIPDSITSMSGSCFFSCPNLREVSLPDSLMTLGALTFYWSPNIQYNEYKGGLYIGNENNPYVVFIQVKDISITSFEVHPDTKIIADHAFCQLTGFTDYWGCESLVNVVLPSELKDIGQGAFYGCTSLETITIPETVVKIGSDAFKNCRSLTNITIPNSVKNIETVGTFAGCFSLTSISLPYNPTIIWGDMFANCPNLESISGLSDVTDVGSDAFYNCVSLKNIDIGGKLTNVGNNAFYNCASLKNIDFGNQLVSVGEKAFYNCKKLENVPFSSNVTTVGQQAFENCQSLKYSVYDSALYLGNDNNPYLVLVQPIHRNISSCDINPNTKVIASYAFSECYALGSVTIPYGIKVIESGVFDYCSLLDNVIIPDSVTTISYQAFHYCASLRNLTIGKSVTNIVNTAFAECYKLRNIRNKSELELKFGSTDNGSVAYYANTIEDADGNIQSNINNSEYYIVTTEEGFVFKVYDEISIHAYLVGYVGNESTITLPTDFNGQDYALREFEGGIHVTVPDSLYYYSWMDANAFDGSKLLESVVLPRYLLSIGYESFYGCTSLKAITIPSNVREVDATAFSRCTSLSSIEVVDENQYFTSIDGNLYTKDGKTLVRYAPAKKEREFTIPYGVTTIASGAFADCTSLEIINIPNTVTSIEAKAFENCGSLKEVTIPNSITSIPEGAFRRCGSLETVKLPDNVTSIGESAFYGCSRLTKIEIPDSVTAIGAYAFYDCINLKNVVIGNGLTEIASYTFENCISLEQVVLGDNVKVIYRAFMNCKSLRQITIPNSVNYIGQNAFFECVLLEEIVFEGTKEEWYSIEKFMWWMCHDTVYTVFCINGAIVENTWHQF